MSAMLRRLRVACYDCPCSILANRKQLATGSFTSRGPSSRYSLSGGCFACTSCEYTQHPKHGQRALWISSPVDPQALTNVSLVRRKLWLRGCRVPNDSQGLVLSKVRRSVRPIHVTSRHSGTNTGRKLTSGWSLTVRAVSREIDHLGTVCNCA